MTQDPTEQKTEMDVNDLWKEDVYTDRKLGSIRKLSPVKPDGSPDAARKATWVGEAQLMTPAGALPLAFELKGETLGQAANEFGPAVQKAFEDAMEELKEMRRRSSSGLVLPGQQGGGMPPGGFGGMTPGMPPGKLKL